MKISFVTSNEIPNGTNDDQLLLAGMQSAGHEVHYSVWSDPSAHWQSYDLICIRSPWDYYKKRNAFLAWALKVQAQLINPYSIVSWNSSKTYLLEIKTKVSSLQTVVESKLDRALTSCTEMLEVHNKVIIKPLVSGSSFKTYVIEKSDNPKSKIKSILEGSECMIQEYVDSVETDGEVSIVFFNIENKYTYSHSIIKKPAAGDFRVQAEFGGSVEAFQPTEACMEVATQCLNAIPEKVLYARIDLIDWKNKPKVGEIELIEPELFFRTNSKAAGLFCKAIETWQS